MSGQDYSALPLVVTTAYVRPGGDDALCDGTANFDVSNAPACAFKTIQRGIQVIAANGTVNVAAGTYVEIGQIVINKNLSIVGADKATTFINPTGDTEGESGTDGRGWFLVNSGVTFNLSNVTLDGSWISHQRGNP